MTTAVKQPQDRKPKSKPKSSTSSTGNAQRDEAEDRDITFEYDGEEWTVRAASAKQLEFLAALEDEDYIVAMRLVLGRDDAARFFRGRSVEDIGRWFDALGEAVDSGNQ